MRINSVNNYTNIQFGKTASLKKVLSSSVSGGKATYLDQAVVKQYLYSLNLPNPNFSALELDKLFKINESAEFIKVCYKELTKKLNISPEIAPKLIFDDVDLPWSFGYERSENRIIINTMYELPDKKETFALLRHELQHYLQCINILRHESLGKKYIENACELYFKEFSDFVQVALLKNSDNSDLDYKTFKKIYQMKNYLDNNDAESYKKELNKEKQLIKKRLKNFRKKIIKSYGVINSDSKITANLEKIYNSFENYNINISWADYLTNPAEYEAHLAEYLMEAEINKACFPQLLKEKYQIFLNSKNKDDIKIKEDLMEKFKQNSKINFVLPSISI